MNKTIFFLFITVSIIILEIRFICLPANYADISAEDGILDLRGLDLSKNMVMLQGEWRMTLDDKESVIVDPADFTIFNRKDFKMGCKSVFTLEILTDENIVFDFFVPEISAEYEIRINGEMLFASDILTNTILNFTPQNGKSLVEITAVRKKISHAGRLSEYPKIGVSPYLYQACMRQRMFATFILGAFFMLGIYHFILYVLSKKEKIYYTFGMLCILGVIDLLFAGDGLLLWFLPGMDVEYYRIDLIAICGFIIYLVAFTSFAFKLEYKKWEKKIMVIFWTIPILAQIFLPVWISIYCLLIGYIPAILFVYKIARTKKYKEDPYLFLYYISILMFMFSGIVEIFLKNYIYMFALTYTTLLMSSQCMILARNYVRALLNVEKVNINLETQVENRTKELSEMNKMLQISQKTIKEMIRNISHDIKTPLTILGQYLEILEEHCYNEKDEKYHAYVHVAYNKNLILQRLIRNLFEVTRMEADQISYNLVWKSVAEIMEFLKDKHSHYIENQGISFKVICEETCDVKIDLDKIWSVFDNIIYNSIRHTPRGGTIGIIISYHENICTIKISDTGEGIKKEHLPYIFDKFYKVEQARNSGGDSGIGLYIVKKNVLGMGGTIMVESVFEEGTVFTLNFLGRVN